MRLATSADPSFTLTRELAEQLRHQGIDTAIGTHALFLGQALVAVNVDGAPHMLVAAYNAEQELSWSITDPYTYAEHSTGTLNGASIEQAARHLVHVLAPYTPAASEERGQDPLQELLETLIAAGHDFQRWSSPTDPHEWLSMPTADGGEITIEGGEARLPRSAASYTGMRAQYAPVADEDFGDHAATLFTSPDLGHSSGGAAGRFAGDLAAVVNAVTACARMAQARTRWESHPAVSMRSAGRYLRQADGTVRLRVTNTVAMSAEELAAKLFEHYAVPYQQGAELPKELEFSELLHVVAFHAEQCAFGHHHWAEDVSGVEDDVREWAAAQVQRLLPYLTAEQTD